MSDNQRHISFEGCFNFRDLGGYRAAHGRSIRWRRLFRSMTPEGMTERDVERARALHIELIIDLRGPDAPGSGALGLPPTRRVAVGPSVSPSWTSAQEQVFRAAPPEAALPMLLERSAPALCQAVVVLAANPGRNVLFHCRLGKDRTGVLSALVLQLLGVSDPDVITDYMYSALFEDEARARLARVGIAPPENESRVAREPASTQAINALLTALRERHGGARQYLERFGVPGSTLDRFIGDLLE